MYVVRIRDPVQFIAADGRPVWDCVLDDAEICESKITAVQLAIVTRRNYPEHDVDIFDLQKKEPV